MAFNGNEGEFISIDKGGQLTAAWRGGGNGDIKGGFLGKDKIQELLDQSGAMGIRIYFGQDTRGDKTVVLVAADADENDILANNLVLDQIVPCPNRCGAPNELNS